MIVKIEKEVKSCCECPYYDESRDMSATIFYCKYSSRILVDINWTNFGKKISEYCEYKE